MDSAQSSWLKKHFEPLEEALSDSISAAINAEPADPLAFLVARLQQSRAQPESGEGGSHDDEKQRLRAQVLWAERQMSEALLRLDALLLEDDSRASSRAGFLRTLHELIGNPPADRTWQDEWPQLMEEADCSGQTIEATLVLYSRTIEQLVEQSWRRESAQAFMLLQNAKAQAPIARALRARSDRFAASTYAVSEHYFDGLRLQRAQQLGGVAPACPSTYRHLGGPGGLSLTEPAWEQITQPDRTGFCGLTCSSVLFTIADPAAFSEKGLSTIAVAEAGVEYTPCDGDVVRFDSAPPDEDGGQHEPLMRWAEHVGYFPPNTLYHLKVVIPPGEWESPRPGVFPQQRLVVVGATYRSPHEGLPEGSGGKMVGSVNTLSYANREDYVRGIDDITARPSLTMELEFSSRPSFTWRDWKGAEYSLAREWAYVTGPAVPAAGTAGQRDADNGGKTPTDFLAEANAFIARRRSELSAGDIPRARRLQQQSSIALLPEEHAFLTLDEVLSVRLYSGPAYQPINAFLREIGGLHGGTRQMLAQHPGYTFAATVSHLCSAIRKLAAAATPEEANATLARGVRGELPHNFWVKDAAGMICAVDNAFMSTSRNRKTPINYMGDGANVLWELQASCQSAEAFHCGADISLLSQFAMEDEVLFPPCTLLVVQATGFAQGSGKAESGVPTLTREEAVDGREKTFLRVRVKPHFL